jgi:TolB-like protein/DNA-binding winged helix-turn-helix (wHTH) protein/predicted negative regulator of RcsB-dependent stress response
VAVLLEGHGVYSAHWLGVMALLNTFARARFGDYVADFDAFELRKHGTRLKLQDQPFQILKILVRRPGQLVTREELCTELWPDSTFVDFDAGLNAAVRRLRDALCDSAEEARYIQTVPRHGYRFIAPVEILAEPSHIPSGELAPKPTNTNGQLDAGATGPTPVVPASPVLQARGIWRTAFVVACILLLAMGLGAIVLRPNVRARHSCEGRIFSVAVLPLQNLSGDPAEDFFADGMTDALITNLAQSSSLKVISSTSSMRYKNPHKGVPEIGRELKVGWILEGSVARAGNHVRVSVQLVDTATDQHLWARQYDGDMHDVLQLQSDIASAVALEVTGKLTYFDKEPSKLRQVNPQAYEAYLKGQYFLNKWSGDGFQKAKAHFEQSINLDPSFADAYAGLAEYYASVAFLDIVPPREASLKSEELLAKTLGMDDRSVKAHTLLGMLKFQFHCDPVGAKKELDYALQLNPADMAALDYHSYYLLELGRTDQAIAEKQQVLDHNPVAVITNAELALYLLQAGRTDEAISRLEKALELDPNYPAAHMRLGFAYTNKKQYDRAAIEFQRAIALDNQPMRVARLGEVYALAGNRQEAVQAIDQLRAMAKRQFVTPTMIAMVHARLGNTAAALEWLNQAKPEDDPKITDPAFDNLRTYPQFKTLEAHLKPDPSCPAF